MRIIEVHQNAAMVDARRDDFRGVHLHGSDCGNSGGFSRAGSLTTTGSLVTAGRRGRLYSLYREPWAGKISHPRNSPTRADNSITESSIMETCD